jgi:hypothetical protein
MIIVVDACNRNSDVAATSIGRALTKNFMERRESARGCP